MAEVILVRHGKSTSNEKEIYGGDYPLCATGQQQSISARSMYRRIEVDKVYSSELIRAVSTAEIMTQKTLNAARILPEFNNIWLGEAENMTKKQTQDTFVNNFDDIIPFLEETHGDDPYEQVREALKRMRGLIMEMRLFPQKYPNSRILIITSDALIRCIIQTIKHGYEWKCFNLPRLANTDAVRITFNDKIKPVDIRMLVSPEEEKIAYDTMAEIVALAGVCTKGDFDWISGKVNKERIYKSFACNYSQENIYDQLLAGDFDVVYILIWNFIRNLQAANYIADFVYPIGQKWLEINKEYIEKEIGCRTELFV